MTNLLLLFALICQPAPIPVPADTAVHFWPEVAAPKPVPVSPDAPTVIEPGKTAVIGSNVEMFFRTYPDGVVRVKKMTGPKSIFYTDDKGETQEKEFTSKFLLVLSADPKLTKTATCQMLLIPKGVSNDKSILARMVEAQVGSKPPPDPIPIPDVLADQAKRFRDWALAVKSPYRATEATLLAVNYRNAILVAHADVAAMSKALQVANQAAVADANEAAWKAAFFVPLQAECKATVKTLADFKAIALQIAIGLEASTK